MGTAVKIPPELEEKKKEMFKENQFNLLASNMISVNRTLKGKTGSCYLQKTQTFFKMYVWTGAKNMIIQTWVNYRRQVLLLYSTMKLGLLLFDQSIQLSTDLQENLFMRLFLLMIKGEPRKNSNWVQ